MSVKSMLMHNLRGICLHFLILFVNIDKTTQEEYCSTFCDDPCEILNVCTRQSRHAPAIAIDSSGAPRNINTSCLCILYHDSDSENEFKVEINSLYIEEYEQMKMELNGHIFNKPYTDSINISSGSGIKYSHMNSSYRNSKLCLRISTVTDNAIPKEKNHDERNINISCFTSDYQPTLSESQTFRTRVPGGVTDENVHIRSTTESNKGSESSTAVIAGSVGGGVALVLIITVVVIYFFCLRHRKKEVREGETNNGGNFEESDYYMKENVNYVSADNVSPLKTYITTERATCDEYAVVNKPKKGNLNHNADSDYNHLNDIKPTFATGNIYNSLETDNYNVPDRAGKGQNTDRSDYDTV